MDIAFRILSSVVRYESPLLRKGYINGAAVFQNSINSHEDFYGEGKKAVCLTTLPPLVMRFDVFKSFVLSFVMDVTFTWGYCFLNQRLKTVFVYIALLKYMLVTSDISLCFGNCVNFVPYLIITFISGKRLGRTVNEDSERSLPASIRIARYHDQCLWQNPPQCGEVYQEGNGSIC
jgi:hypothetical protein